MTRLGGATPHRAGTAEPSVQAWVLPHLIGWVEAQGVDASPIRDLPGMGDLCDPDLRVPETSVEAAWRLAASSTHDEAAGVHLAEWLPRGALDLVEYAFRSSPSLAAGFERLVRYAHVISDRAAIQLRANGDGLQLQVRDAGHTPLHPGRAEFALAMSLKLARDSTGRDITPEQVCFAHPHPRDDSQHRRFFRVPVAFNAGSTSMILSDHDVALPLLGADEALCGIVRRRLDKTLAERRTASTGPFGERVRRFMVERLGHRVVTPPAVAKMLHVSQRTLSRRLADEGTSFRDILDDVRRETACALLHDRSLSVGEIAFFLQYSEPAAFHRAFRRWTGGTPRDFRAAVTAMPTDPAAPEHLLNPHGKEDQSHARDE